MPSANDGEQAPSTPSFASPHVRIGMPPMATVPREHLFSFPCAHLASPTPRLLCSPWSSPISSRRHKSGNTVSGAPQPKSTSQPPPICDQARARGCEDQGPIAVVPEVDAAWAVEAVGDREEVGHQRGGGDVGQVGVPGPLEVGDGVAELGALVHLVELALTRKEGRGGERRAATTTPAVGGAARMGARA